METMVNSVLDDFPISRGKVRDMYEDGDNLLIVTTDRISAMDEVLPDPVPGKGRVLNGMTLFWMRMMEDIVKNHIITDDVARYPDRWKSFAGALAGRSVLARKAKPLPVECIVRGYITGSGWKSYLADGTVCGHTLPEGLKESEKLPEPIFTPSTKAAQGEHDENITVARAGEIVGPDLIRAIEEKAVAIYRRAHDYARERGIIIADTKLEFGLVDGELTLIDEVLTPDSSRFWDLADYEPGRPQKSFDKQPLRDWIKANPGQRVPADVLAATGERYRKAQELLTK